jgi:hypothetical protein
VTTNPGQQGCRSRLYLRPRDSFREILGHFDRSNNDDALPAPSLMKHHMRRAGLYLDQRQSGDGRHLVTRAAAQGRGPWTDASVGRGTGRFTTSECYELKLETCECSIIRWRLWSNSRLKTKCARYLAYVHAFLLFVLFCENNHLK